MSKLIQRVDHYLSQYVEKLLDSKHPALGELRKSMEYSTKAGGKRFRPLLSIGTAQVLGKSEDFIMPYATAVELVHTYSLIHNDLPIMDNDDFRRGRPSNHKIFGESLALLAGNALMSEAFELVANTYQEPEHRVLKVIAKLARSIGPRGMIGGQAIDTSKHEGEWEE